MFQSADVVIYGSLFGARERKARQNSVELGSAQLALTSLRIGLRALQSSAHFAQKSGLPGHSVGTADTQMTALRNISFLGPFA